MAGKRRDPAPRFLTLGWQVIEWAEAMLVHGPGDVQGEPLRLTDEACGFIVRAYQLREDGRRVVRRAGLSRPKGWAKTELAGVLAACELAGPVRFDGFDADGEPVGRPVTAPLVRVFATEEGQATSGTYDAAAYMLGHGEAFNEYRLDVGASRTFLAGGGELLASTSAPTSAEGGRDTFDVFDETHLWISQRLRELHRVSLRNLGKRSQRAEPWSLETSTRFRPGESSVAEALDTYWRQLQSGELGDPVAAIAAAGVLLDMREAPPLEGKLRDLSDEVLEAALLEAYGDAAEFVDFARIIAEIRDPEADDADSRRYWLNQAVRGEDSWLGEGELELFDALAVEGHEPPDGEAITIGFDGSLSDDATVLIGCTLGREGKPFVWPIGVWEIPPDASPRDRADWVVDREDVIATVHEAFDRWDVLLLYGDPAYWVPELAAWASEYGDDVVREWPTHRDYRMAPAQDALRAAILTAELEHDGDAAMRRHFANAHARRTRHGVTIRKDKPGSPHKIDAAVGSALALAARNDAIADNLDDRRQRRKRRKSSNRKRAPSKLHTFK